MRPLTSGSLRICAGSGRGSESATKPPRSSPSTLVAASPPQQQGDEDDPEDDQVDHAALRVAPEDRLLQDSDRETRSESNGKAVEASDDGSGEGHDQGLRAGKQRGLKPLGTRGEDRAERGHDAGDDPHEHAKSVHGDTQQLRALHGVRSSPSADTRVGTAQEKDQSTEDQGHDSERQEGTAGELERAHVYACADRSVEGHDRADAIGRAEGILEQERARGEQLGDPDGDDGEDQPWRRNESADERSFDPGTQQERCRPVRLRRRARSSSEQPRQGERRASQRCRPIFACAKLMIRVER